MKIMKLLSIIIVLICIIGGCKQVSISAKNDIEDLSDEQIEALGRLDPLYFLTDNKSIFSLTEDEVLTNLGDKIDLPEDATQLPDGKIELESYAGCTEPIYVSFYFHRNGQLAKIEYGMSNYSNTPNVIEDYSSFLSRVRDDMIMVFGDNYTENILRPDGGKTFEEVLEALNANDFIAYDLNFSSVMQLGVTMDASENGVMDEFNIALLLSN